MRKALGLVCAALILVAGGLAGGAGAKTYGDNGPGGHPPALGPTHTGRQGHNCPRGETLTNGQCACPVGKEMIHGRCVSPTGCPPPGQFANGQCVATPTCPASYHLSNGQCIARVR